MIIKLYIITAIVFNTTPTLLYSQDAYAFLYIKYISDLLMR